MRGSHTQESSKIHLARHQNSAKCVIASRKDDRWQIQIAERQRAEDTIHLLMEKGPHFQPQSEKYYFLVFEICCNNFSFHVQHKP